MMSQSTCNNARVFSNAHQTCHVSVVTDDAKIIECHLSLSKHNQLQSCYI